MSGKVRDLVLVAAWVLYIAIVGPFLISAPSYIALTLGIGIAIALGVFTWRRFQGGKKDE